MTEWERIKEENGRRAKAEAPPKEEPVTLDDFEDEDLSKVFA